MLLPLLLNNMMSVAGVVVDIPPIQPPPIPTVISTADGRGRYKNKLRKELLEREDKEIMMLLKYIYEWD